MEGSSSDLAAIIRDLSAVCSGSETLQMGMRRYVRFPLASGSLVTRSDKLIPEA